MPNIMTHSNQRRKKPVGNWSQKTNCITDKDKLHYKAKGRFSWNFNIQVYAPKWSNIFKETKQKNVNQEFHVFMYTRISCIHLLLHVRTTGKRLSTYTEIKNIASINLFWRIYWKINFRLLRWLERHWQECWWWALNT